LTKFVGVIPFASDRGGLEVLRAALVSGVALALLAGMAGPADAQYRGWGYGGSGFYAPVDVQPRSARSVRRDRDASPARSEKAEVKKDSGFGEMSKGPQQIIVNIGTQKVTLYSNGVRVAQGPVATGMPGHPTPQGVFSIIEKDRYHHSNIYSGAPMPFMQRITWSGVALHAGVVPGYPASHGCIRLPTAFAIKMWNWTKMGARVIITPGEITPARFSHPLLVAQKVVPVANEAPQVDAPLGVKSDKGADAKPPAKPVDTADVSLELRSTVGHGPLTQTADASGAMPANAAVTMSDASPAGASGEATTVRDPEATDTEAKPETAKSDEAKPETAKSDVEPASANSAEAASTEDKPADIVTGEIKTPEATATDSPAVKAEASVKTEEKAAEPEAKAFTPDVHGLS